MNSDNKGEGSDVANVLSSSSLYARVVLEIAKKKMIACNSPLLRILLRFSNIVGNLAGLW
jgi:hypothetical protein